MKSQKGPTRAQLQRKIAHLEGKVTKLERQKAKLMKLLQGDSLRREGEHWYELVEYFDAQKIERVNMPGAPANVYAMGYLDDVLVLQVPQDEAPESIEAFRQLMKNHGLAVPFLYITEGVRFVKLATVSPETEAILDKAELAKAEVEDGEEDPGDLPVLRAQEGRPEAGEVLSVPGDVGAEADTGGADPEPHASRR